MMLMDWSKGFSAEYYMAIVDPSTWRDVERVEITGGSVTRAASGLLHSADINCTRFNPGAEKWIRVWLVAKQNDDIVHEPLFTGLTSAPERNVDGNRASFPLACYSVLKPAEDVLLPRGFFVGAGQSGAEVIKDLLAVTPAPVTAEDMSPKLRDIIIAENGESHLSMATKVLNAIGWNLSIDGGGTIHIGPMDISTKKTFGVHNDVIEPIVQLKADWFSCPNVFRAVSGEQVATARDDDPDSPLSTISRGREIWKEDLNVHLGDHEGLEQYAARRLKEEQSVVYSVSYDRRYDPVIKVGDVVQLDYPGQGVSGVYVVSSQNIDLGYGAKVSEEVVR